MDKSFDNRAIEEYSNALKIKPDDIEALFNRCIAYEDKGEYGCIIADLKRILKIKPDHTAALEAIKMFKSRGWCE